MAGNVLFKLLGQVFIDTDEANKSLSKTTENAESMTDKLGKGAKTVGKFATATVGVASAMSTALMGNAKNTAQATDEIDKMSQKLGLTREGYQEWDYILSQAGVDISSMETGMKTLTNKLDDAKNGSASAQAMFEKLGISMEDINNMSREELFEKSITGFQGMADSTERAALANDLFGKSGQNLTALFNESAESTEALKQKAHDLGMVMSDEAVESGVEFTDAMDTLNRTFATLGNSVGTALMPAITDVVNMIVDNLPMIQDMIKDLAPVFNDLISQLLPPLVELIQTILPPLLALIKAILPIVTTVASGVVKAVTWIVGVVSDTIGAITGFIGGIIDFINDVFLEGWKEAWQMVVDVFGGIFGGILDIVKAPINAIIGALNGIFSALSIDIPDWVPIIGGKTLGLPQIPMLATGGEITESGSVIVGEKGPELLNLNQGASVVPLSKDAVGTDSVIRAIQEMSNNIVNAISNNTNVVKIDDPYRIFKLVKDEEKKYNTMTTVNA